MSKRTEYFIIGLGVASILAGVFAGFRTGEIFESISGIFIGVSLIGTVIIQRNDKEKSDLE